MQKQQMRVLNKDNIKLPYMGRDKFIELMKTGVGYERGTFYIKDTNRAEEIRDALSEILNEEIAFPQTCLICEKEFLCIECKYYDTCSSKNLPFHCICKSCSVKSNLYDRYVEKNQHLT